MAKQKVIVSIMADASQFQRTMSRLGDVSGLNRLGNGLKALGATLVKAGAAATVAGVALGTKMVHAAADLEQSIGGVDAIFKESASSIHTWASGASSSVGLTRNAYNELATVIGAQLKNAGTAMDELAPKTDNLIRLGADMAATFGGTTADAVAAISSALKNERDPIEKYGVSLNQAAVDAKAAELGFTKVGNALSAEASQAATVALIMEQTADAHGQFGREADTVAQRLQVFKAKLGDAAATLGTYLLPAVSAAIGWLSGQLEPAVASLVTWIEGSLVPALQNFAAWAGENIVPALAALGGYLTGTVVPAVVAFAAGIAQAIAGLDTAAIGAWVQALAPYAAAILAVVAALRIYHTIIVTVTAAKAAWAAAQALLNAVMMANPLGLVVLGIIALVAAIVTLWHTNEGFRNAVTQLWEGIKSAISSAVDWCKAAIARLSEVPGDVAAWFESTRAQAAAKWESIKSAISSAVDAVRGFIERLSEIPGKVAGWFADMVSRARARFDELVSQARALPGLVVAALGALGGMLAAAAVQHFGQLIIGATTKAAELVAFVRSIPSRVVGALGNLGGLLVGAGRSIIQGFLNGLRSAFDSVKSFVGGIGSWIAANKGPRAYDLALLVPAGRWIMQGLQAGIASQIPALRRTLSAVSATITSAPLGHLTPTPAPASGAGYVPAPIHVEVHAMTGGVEAGRAVAAALRDYETARRLG